LAFDKNPNSADAEQPDVWMFHESEAPQGRVFPASEVPQLRRKGWVDTTVELFSMGLCAAKFFYGLFINAPQQLK
jgi:hypothetical protein